MSDNLHQILLAEDNEIAKRIIVHKLESENYSVVHLATGENVVETVLAINPILIILDLLLPVRNGLTILRDLKLNPVCSSTPVIIFTTNNNEDMLNKALELGAVDYILKPFSISEMMSKIKKYSNT
ncbi:MAG: response regulator [Ignavibacteriaceae bacterium]